MTMPASSVVTIAFLVAACGGTPSQPAQPVQPANVADLIILNGKVHVADEKNTVAQAVAVKGNTILRVGTTNEIKALAGPSTRVIDARGGTVAPGFNDAHVHFIEGGLALKQADLAGLTALAEVQAAIREFAAKQPAGAWIAGRGWLYTPFPGGSPTAAQLDAVVPDRPAVMDCYDGHSIWVNSVVLKLAGITRATRDPVNGVIVRDPKTGEYTMEKAPCYHLVADEKQPALQAAKV